MESFGIFLIEYALSESLVAVWYCGACIASSRQVDYTEPRPFEYDPHAKSIGLARRLCLLSDVAERFDNIFGW